MVWDALPQEISDFCAALRRVPETERTADVLAGLQGAFNTTWRSGRTVRSGAGIPIPPPRNKAIFPRACAIDDAELSFIFALGDSIEKDLFPARCDFQVKVSGVAIYKDSVLVELQDHWRVDTYIEPKPATAGIGAPREPHPLIHFQRGGHAQDAFAGHELFVPGDGLGEGEWRSLLQSPGPRVPFPPFCPVLAIDYAIGQHDGNVHRKLRAIPEYTTEVQRAQTRLWEPFFAAMATSAALRKRWLGSMLL
ncbi:hypothetical protein [Methylibium sp.]|uniref:hypothetical protein n=1 Tax=Methylibium sp. TaxID=2067992 RepID=UPI003340BE89